MREKKRKRLGYKFDGECEAQIKTSTNNNSSLKYTVNSDVPDTTSIGTESFISGDSQAESMDSRSGISVVTNENDVQRFLRRHVSRSLKLVKCT